MSILTVEIDFNADAPLHSVTLSELGWAVAEATRLLLVTTEPAPVVLCDQVVGRAYWKGGLLVMSSVWPKEEALSRYPQYRLLANGVERAGYTAPGASDAAVAAMMWSVAAPWALNGHLVEVVKCPDPFYVIEP
jgi:hypothetical protein